MEQASEAAFGPILLSTMAGVATGLGGALTWCVPRQVPPQQLAFSLGFAAGVMTTVSVFDLWWSAAKRVGPLATLFFGAAGCGLYWALVLLQRLSPLPAVLYPEPTLPLSDPHATEPKLWSRSTRARQLRLGLLTALVLTLHNFPEGLAVALSSFESSRLGSVMALAIAMHNIPEGLVIAMPIFAATGSRLKGLALALASGLSEPLGAALAVWVFRPIVDSEPQVIQYLLSGVGGLMVAVSAFELLPEALSYSRRDAVLTGATVGSVIMLATIAIV